MDEQERDCFVGLAPCCGRVVFAAVDNPEHRDENSRSVAKLIRQGYKVETWPSPKVRAADWGCKCEKSARKGRAA